MIAYRIASSLQPCNLRNLSLSRALSISIKHYLLNVSYMQGVMLGTVTSTECQIRQEFFPQGTCRGILGINTKKPQRCLINAKGSEGRSAYSLRTRQQRLSHGERSESEACSIGGSDSKELLQCRRQFQPPGNGCRPEFLPGEFRGGLVGWSMGLQKLDTNE